MRIFFIDLVHIFGITELTMIKIKIFLLFHLNNKTTVHKHEQRRLIYRIQKEVLLMETIKY